MDNMPYYADDFLVQAAGKGILSEVRRWLKVKANPNHRWSYKSHGFVKVMHSEAREVAGATALTMAAERGHFHIAMELLNAGADANQTGHSIAYPWGGNGECAHGTPLMFAAANDHGKIAERLAKRLTAENFVMPLCLAVAHGHVGVVNMLLSAGADPHQLCDSIGENINTDLGDKGDAMFLAILHGRPDMAKVLLSAGVDRYQKNSELAKWRLTCSIIYHGPALYHYDASLVALLAAGADINREDTERVRRVYDSAEKRVHTLMPTFAEHLIFRCNPKTLEGILLSESNLSKRKKLAEQMRKYLQGETKSVSGYRRDYEYKCDQKLEMLSNLADKKLIAPAKKATTSGKQLEDMESGFDIDDEDGGIETIDAAENTAAFIEAARNDDFAEINIRLIDGADPNFANDDGWTPLMVAVLCDGVQAVEALLNLSEDVPTKKADPNVRNNAGKTALDLASSDKPEKTKIRELLVKAGGKKGEEIQ